jgi:hypothetical protein
MARTNQPPQATDETQREIARSRFRYPEPLTQEDLEAMDHPLPDDVTAAHLRWLETGEGDPWGERSG